jgi:hypothetical protein
LEVFVENADGMKFTIKALAFAEFLAIKIEFIILPSEDVNAYLISMSWQMVVAAPAPPTQIMTPSLNHASALLDISKILGYASVPAITMKNLSMENASAEVDTT